MPIWHVVLLDLFRQIEEPASTEQPGKIVLINKMHRAHPCEMPRLENTGFCIEVCAFLLMVIIMFR